MKFFILIFLNCTIVLAQTAVRSKPSRPVQSNKSAPLSKPVQPFKSAPNSQPVLKKKIAVKSAPLLDPPPREPYRVSVLLGLISNTLKVKVTDGVRTEDVENTGNSVGIAVAVERHYFIPGFVARGLIGLDQFNAIGAASVNGCDNRTSKDCRTDIKYLSLGFYPKYEWNLNPVRYWVAPGMNVKMPISKSSTALSESSLGMTVAYGLSLGLDFSLAEKSFLATSAEVQYFIKSDSAETSSLFVRIGYGREF